MSLHELGLVDAARAIRRKELSPVDLVDALLDRAANVDGPVQAWALLDRDGARKAARQAADDLARGVLRGPMHGVPFGAKDIFYSAGLRTEGGSKVMAGFVPTYDATAVARLKAAGATVADVALPPSFDATFAAAYLITRSDTTSIHAERYAAKADLYRPSIRASIEIGMLIPGDLYVRALRIRSQFRRELRPTLARYDVLLTPTTPTPAPQGMATGDPRFQIPWSLSGFPSITVPCGFSASGLPLGLQLVSDMFTEAPLFAAAAWCEDVLGRAPAPSL